MCGFNNALRTWHGTCRYRAGSMHMKMICLGRREWLTRLAMGSSAVGVAMDGLTNQMESLSTGRDGSSERSESNSPQQQSTRTNDTSQSTAAMATVAAGAGLLTAVTRTTENHAPSPRNNTPSPTPPPRQPSPSPTPPPSQNVSSVECVRVGQ